MSISITIFSKKGGPLTKRISLDEDGLINSDGSACVMTNGVAKRADIANVDEFADLIGNLEPNQAIALGQMRSGLPPRVSVVTKARLEEVNGAAGPRVIARTAQDLIYRKGRRAMALLDFDAKGMPDEMADELEERGGFWAALVSVLPVLGEVARVTRRSTSSGLFRSDTGESVPGSDGIHVYIEARDGSDIERFLGALHARCWLAGLGWMMVGAGGQLLERSIIDRMVGAPERLAFEGAPILEKPLKQRGRRPVAVDGDVLNTVRACPPLTVTETAKLRQLKEREAHRLAGEAAKARAAFIDRQAEGLAKRAKISTEAAKQIVARQCDGVLLSDVELPFDDPDLAGCTVADVLDDPDRFDGATLADPLEGIEYGVCKAKVMRRPDGSLWIHSF